MGRRCLSVRGSNRGLIKIVQKCRSERGGLLGVSRDPWIHMKWSLGEENGRIPLETGGSHYRDEWAGSKRAPLQWADYWATGRQGAVQG